MLRLSRSLSMIVATVVAGVSLAPAIRADDAPKSGAPAAGAGKPVDPIVSLIERLKEDQPLDVRMAALKEAGGTEDPRLVAPLAHLLKADEEGVRLAAVTALSNIRFTDARKRAATLLLERSKVVNTAYQKDMSRKPELIAVFRGLHDLAQESTIDGILDGIEAGVDLDVVEARAMAVANVPSAKAIEGLIGYMSRRARDGSGIRAAITRALDYATGVKGANDDDAWRAWWRDAKATFNFEAAYAERERARTAKADAAAKKAADAAKKGDRKKKRDPAKPKDGETPPEGEKPPEGDKPPADGGKPSDS